MNIRMLTVLVVKSWWLVDLLGLYGTTHLLERDLARYKFVQVKRCMRNGAVYMPILRVDTYIVFRLKHPLFAMRSFHRVFPAQSPCYKCYLKHIFEFP